MHIRDPDVMGISNLSDAIACKRYLPCKGLDFRRALLAASRNIGHALPGELEQCPMPGLAAGREQGN